MARPAPARRRSSSRTWATRASPSWSARLTDWPGRIVATALVDVEPQRAATFARGIADRFRTAAGPATALLGRITAADPDATTVDVLGLDPLAGPVTARLPTAGRHNASNALGVAARGRGAWARARTRSSRGWRPSAASGRRLERKGEAHGVVVYDDYGHHPTAIRETLGRGPPARARPARLGGLRAADLPPDRGAARRVRRRARGRRRGRHRGHLGGPRPRHHDRLRRRASRRAVARAQSAASPPPRRARWRPPPAGSPTRSATGDVVLVMGGGRSYRIGELLLEHLEAAMTLTYAAGHDLLERRTARRGRPTTATRYTALFADEAEVVARPVRRRRWPGTTPCGHTCSRRPRPSATTTSRSSGTGSPGTPPSPPGTPAGTARDDETAKVRQAGFLAAEVGEDGRIGRLKHVDSHPRAPRGLRKERDVAGDISFDVVSDFDEQELRNALDQVRREVQQRYDFKGAHVDLTQEKDAASSS